MSKMNQNNVPFVEALKNYIAENTNPFDVPGHHMGNIDNDFIDYVGKMAYKVDVNAPKGLDNLSYPHGVIKEAEALMADAFHAKDSFFLINGTTSGILAMIMITCNRKEKIILPRNVHKSVINGLILSGASPVFIMPMLDNNLEIANQPTVDEYVNAMNENPEAKAVLVINPTYFGAVCDLKTIVSEAHKRDMIVLVDEAHGAHFVFETNGPLSAMDCDADFSAISLHKTGGSLTQSSVLLLNTDKYSRYDVLKVLNILNSTSPSSLLIASLDAARKELALKGKEMLDEVISLSNYARDEINKINGFSAPSTKYFKEHGAYNFDVTKLVIEIGKVGLNGFQLYNMLKDEYHVQMELAESYTLLAIISIGTKKEHIDSLVSALKSISLKYYNEKHDFIDRKFDISFPEQVLRPRSTLHAPVKKVLLENAENLISKEAIMVYPPGIPLIIPGEVFSKEIINRIKYYRSVGATIFSDFDNGYVSTVDEEWESFDEYQDDFE